MKEVCVRSRIFYLFLCIGFAGVQAGRKPVTLHTPKKIQKNIVERSSLMGKLKVPEVEQIQSYCIKNGITDDMITYKKHWAKPTPQFILTVDGKELKSGDSYLMPTDKKMVKIEYECIFKKGFITYHREKKAIEVPAQKKSMEVRFDWDKPERLLVAHMDK